MATNTTNYSFKKPTVSGDSGVWGGYLNDDLDDLDGLLGGDSPITGIDINSGAIDNATIGAATPNTGAFTTLSASSTFTLGATAITATGTEINVLDGIPATLTATELGYCDGVGSAIQTQLDAKYASASMGTGVETFLGTPSSANLSTAITDETGSGSLVFANSPTFVTPALGTPASGTLSGCTVDGTDAVGFKNIPQQSKSADYTLVLADAGKHIFHPAGDASTRTFTIPANASVAYVIGTAITFINMTSQVVTIAITSDTMYLSDAGTTGSRSLAQYGSATAIKITATNWVISGSGLT